MFSSRKYTPLPTSSGPQRRSGMPVWKRWAFIGTGVLVLMVVGYARFPSTRSTYDETWETDNAYTPQLGGEKLENDMTDYSEFKSPPFRPIGAGSIAEPGVADTDEGRVHALPFNHLRPKPGFNDDASGTEADEDEEEAANSPHNPLSDQAQEAQGAQNDFTEIDNTPEVVVMTFETDPDPASTTACADPYDSKRPLVQYALTIDAGSTGSRIHVYKFHNCGPSPTLEYETFKMLNPGLSAYARDPTAAAASLDPLLREAKRVVPKSLWSCTPVEVKATAGLRLLGTDESNAILDEVRNRLETYWPFSVPNQNAVEIMDGKDEGVYAWITANYLLGKIGEGAKSTDTLAVMDLGGASTQIVFEPKFPADSTQELVDGEHKYQLSFGGKDFTLYQHSYLGYGLMRARRSVHNLVAFTWSFGHSNLDWDTLSENEQVPNPCLSRGTTRRVELDPPGRTAVNVTMHGSNGGFDACNRVVELVMAKDDVCEVKPCSFAGQYQPSLLDTFPHGQLLALSYFTDRIKPLLSGRTADLKIADLTEMAKDVCDGPEAWRLRWGSDAAAMAELEDRPEYCLDLTFMNALLGLGYELGPERDLLVEKKLNGVELGWALGAGLALVEKATLTCTASANASM
ncbi:nucleoside phosphatase family-domain-containing protein [Kockovaella imperatae]|uniref:guanosine-diphosphatase n=1 Tax=Kockovaella imperatae TaxID=4999 RepID=A0A1Y1U8D5_9TREE|nr:nucleoside phosphatase family-domain-containing protein [Kockovaella imperatae]ORX33804.1 nucleoside phosphatase family-domain-containing protein [Kockovaella imperatae]